MKKIFAAALALAATGAPARLAAAPISIAIDIDSTRISGSDTSGPLVTQPGFVSWNLTNVGTAGSTIVEQATTFEIFGLAAANQSRVRPAGGDGTANDDLTQDFVFNDGGSRAVGLRISGLDVGTYSMQSWHFDSGVGNENFIQVEVRNMGDASGPPIVDMLPFGPTPASFQFQVTAAGQVKEIIFREDDAPTATDSGDQNRARLNGFTLVTVPEPATAILLAMGLTALAAPRRR
jgi:hypothetical protein